MKQFFETHSALYATDTYKQGLFLLGVIINGILSAQKDKKGTILSKMNFDGMPVNRIQQFVNSITEYLRIYDDKIFHKISSPLYANMIDRIQGIEKSKLTKDEVIFYILSGISFSNYLSIKYAKEKKSLNKGENNDNNSK